MSAASVRASEASGEGVAREGEGRPAARVRARGGQRRA